MKHAEKQARWKKLRTTLDRDTRRCEANKCRNKYRHGDFLSGMQHASQLTEMCGALYSVYFCEDCGYAHVGNVGAKEVVWMMGFWAERITLQENARDLRVIT